MGKAAADVCGIAGLIGANSPVSWQRLARCSDRLRHRGPDDLGYLGYSPESAVRLSQEPEELAGSTVALAHRRLAILDLSRAGRQPMSNGDGSLHLMLNGEIYNYRELRAELEGSGHRFNSRTDTEVLLAALERWGVDALRRLVGMFSLALLDSHSRRLLLARDPFGIKPLYYWLGDGQAAFCSEIPALLDLVEVKPRANPLAVYHYLRFGITDHNQETFFAGIRQLEPAHYLVIDLATGAAGEPCRYWELCPEEPARLTFAEAAARLRELLLESITLHLRSDVPVGACLSGGLDSSTIVAAMRAVGGASLDLHTVSYVADDPELSEARWIELAASSSGAFQHTVAAASASLESDLDFLLDAQAEPFSSTSIYAQLCVFRAAASAGLKVMLDGQGGDELLGGYRFFLAARLVSLLRQGRIAPALRLWRQAQSLPGLSGRDLFSWLGFHLLPQSLHRIARALSGRPLLPTWLEPAYFSGLELDSSPLHQVSSRQALHELQVATLRRTSLPMLLRFEDRNSMAFSIESRVPFLTPALAHFLLSLPEEYLIGADGTGKAVMRAAMRGLVPDPILKRRDKIGFATPERRWLAEQRTWLERVLRSEAAANVPSLRRQAMLKEWEGILAGRNRFDWHVWRWVNLIRWAERMSVSFTD